MQTAARFNGKLTQWNADRGFGFLVAEHGDQAIFVHVSAFPRDGRVPVVGEPLSFELELDKEGRKRAVRLRRPGTAEQGLSRHPARDADHAHHPRDAVRDSLRRSREPSRTGSFVSTLIALLLLTSVGGWVYTQYTKRMQVLPLETQSMVGRPAPAASPTAAPAASMPVFTCDGRKHCSQMTSCSEARQYLRNCPGMEMDGDHDGIPCEEQWCSGPLGG